MSDSMFRKPLDQYLKRMWSKNRRPWEGDFDGVESLRAAMWKSIFDASDRKRYGFTVAEVAAAARIVKIESENHGAAELGFGSPYDRDRIEASVDALYHQWMNKKRPKNLT